MKKKTMEPGRIERINMYETVLNIKLPVPAALLTRIVEEMEKSLAPGDLMFDFAIDNTALNGWILLKHRAHPQPTSPGNVATVDEWPRYTVGHPGDVIRKWKDENHYYPCIGTLDPDEVELHYSGVSFYMYRSPMYPEICEASEAAVRHMIEGPGNGGL